MNQKSRATTLSQKGRVGHTQSTASTKGARHAKAEYNLPARSKPNPAQFQKVTPEQRWRLIAAAAHARAEKRRFATGNPIAVHRDWLASMADVDAQLKRAGQSLKKSAVKKSIAKK